MTDGPKDGAGLWGGRFQDGLAPSAIDLSYSIDSDKRLYPYDIAVNRVHAQALGEAGILTTEEVQKIDSALDEITVAFETTLMHEALPDEDIHACIERLVTEKLGDLGKKLHTGKSRNDQVATDVRLYIKEELRQVDELLTGLLHALYTFASQHVNLVFPGFTHLQVAQPISFAHHILAYFEKFQRDWKRFRLLAEDTDECPLGSAAMVGTNYPIDREAVAKALGFSRLTQNSMDAVSARDVMCHVLSTMAVSMAHLSQLSEELIFWSSPVVNFIEIGDAFTTGSSIMPQKKNPDMAELTRGKTGPMLGRFVALHEIIKGLPLTYNRDLQEDKPLLFASFDEFKQVLRCFSEMIPSIRMNEERINSALTEGFSLATEIADYLVLKGVPFRDAHHITGQIVQHAIKDGKTLEEIPVDALRSFSDAIGEDIASVLNTKSAVSSKNCIGGTAFDQVNKQLQLIKERYKW